MRATADDPGKSVTVRLFAGLRDLFDSKELHFGAPQPANIGELLRALCVTSSQKKALLAESGVIKEGVLVLINGQTIAAAGGVDATLREGDEVAIFPPMYGG